MAKKCQRRGWLFRRDAVLFFRQTRFLFFVFVVVCFVFVKGGVRFCHYLHGLVASFYYYYVVVASFGFLCLPPVRFCLDEMEVVGCFCAFARGPFLALLQTTRFHNLF